MIIKFPKRTWLWANIVECVIPKNLRNADAWHCDHIRYARYIKMFISYSCLVSIRIRTIVSSLPRRIIEFFVNICRLGTLSGREHLAESGHRFGKQTAGQERHMWNTNGRQRAKQHTREVKPRNYLCDSRVAIHLVRFAVIVKISMNDVSCHILRAKEQSSSVIRQRFSQLFWSGRTVVVAASQYSIGNRKRLVQLQRLHFSRYRYHFPNTCTRRMTRS